MTYRVACPLCSPQPRSTDTPDGWTADTGTAKGTFPSGWNKKGGWPFACDREHLGRPLYDAFIQLQALAITAPGLTGSWSIDLPNGTYPVVLMCGDATSRAQTNTLSLNGKTVVDSTPYDGRITNGYERGSFDGYAVQVVVTNGRLTIAAAKGGWNAKVNFIEIGARGALLDQATRDRVTAAAAEATRATAHEKAAVPPLVKRQMWGSYVDELVSYSVKKPRKMEMRYFAFANHLYSVAGVTNAVGQTVERYSYSGYGERAVRRPWGLKIAFGAVNNTRGFTGYSLDEETALYHSKARKYCPIKGRFVNRDPLEFVDGMSLYAGYFVPNRLDPNGMWDQIVNAGNKILEGYDAITIHSIRLLKAEKKTECSENEDESCKSCKKWTCTTTTVDAKVDVSIKFIVSKGNEGNSALFQHELIHASIAKKWGKTMEDEVKAATGTGSKCCDKSGAKEIAEKDWISKVNSAKNAALQGDAEEQSQYDNETEHGTNDQQGKWNDKYK